MDSLYLDNPYIVLPREWPRPITVIDVQLGVGIAAFREDSQAVGRKKKGISVRRAAGCPQILESVALLVPFIGLFSGS